MWMLRVPGRKVDIGLLRSASERRAAHEQALKRPRLGDEGRLARRREAAEPEEVVEVAARAHEPDGKERGQGGGECRRYRSRSTQPRSGHFDHRRPGTLKRTLPSTGTRIGVAALVGAAALSGLAVARAGPSPRQQDTDLQSQAIAGQLHFVAYLPRSYDQGTTRYPVVYLLHGLPATGTGYRGVGFVEQALDATGSPAILDRAPGLDRQQDRSGVPRPGAGQPLGHGDHDASSCTSSTRAFARSAHAAGARSSACRPEATARCISALAHLDQFAVVESWSGYFHPTDPTGTKPLDLGSPVANAQADVHRQLQASRTQLKALPTFIAFYVPPPRNPRN